MSRSLAALLLLLLLGCGEEVSNTRTAGNAALNFYTFLEHGEVANAEAYYPPRTISSSDVSKVAAAAARLKGYVSRSVLAHAQPISDSNLLTERDWTAAAIVTVTAELQPPGKGWQPGSEVLTATLVNTSIGWRVRDFKLWLPLVGMAT